MSKGLGRVQFFQKSVALHRDIKGALKKVYVHKIKNYLFLLCP